MKIAISGTHGTGKTHTMFKLANEYKEKYPDKEVTVVTEVARDCPLPINQDTTIQAQQWMISDQIKKEIEAEMKCDIVITDRSFADYLAYSKYKNEDFYFRMLPFLKYYIYSYDLIIYKSLENNGHFLVDDGTRAMDKKFQAEIDRILLEIYDVLKGNIKKIKII